MFKAYFMNCRVKKLAKKYRLNRLKSLFLGFGIILLMTVQTANAAIQCGKISTEAYKDKIVTILEEEIGGPTGGADSGEEVKSCIRKTTFDAEGKAGNPEYVEVGGCSPDEKTNCKRVQVILASTGADLLYSYVGIIYRWAAGTIGIVSVLFLVVGGFEIATAGGDTGRMDKAKARIMQSLAGLVLLFLSALILFTVNPNFFTK